MRAMVVFESMFGNTQTVARRIAEGLATDIQVDLVEVGTASTELPAEVRLLVLGGPTHAFGLTRAETRADAAKKTAERLVSSGTGIREWLQSLHTSTGRMRAATFDTRVDHPRVPGSAAKGAAKRLKKLGFQVVDVQSFFVDGVTGPLIEGEEHRALEWGRRLAGELEGSEVRSAG